MISGQGDGTGPRELRVRCIGVVNGRYTIAVTGVTDSMATNGTTIPAHPWRQRDALTTPVRREPTLLSISLVAVTRLYVYPRASLVNRVHQLRTYQYKYIFISIRTCPSRKFSTRAIVVACARAYNQNLLIRSRAPRGQRWRAMTTIVRRPKRPNRGPDPMRLRSVFASEITAVTEPAVAI